MKIGKIPMSSVACAIERDETTGAMKPVVDAANDRIRGAAIPATEGGKLVQMLGTLMLAGPPYTLLKGAVYIHPALAEGFFTLMKASSRSINYPRGPRFSWWAQSSQRHQTYLWREGHLAAQTFQARLVPAMTESIIEPHFPRAGRPCHGLTQI